MMKKIALVFRIGTTLTLLMSGVSLFAAQAIDFPTTDPAWQYQSITPPNYTPNRSSYGGYDERRGVSSSLNIAQQNDSSNPLYTVNISLNGSYKDGAGNVFELSPLSFTATLGRPGRITLNTTRYDGANHSQTISYDYRTERGTPTLYLDSNARGVIILPLSGTPGQTLTLSGSGDRYGTLQNITATVFVPYGQNR